jgi:hypothetical protein
LITRKYEFYVSTGFVGSHRQETVEIEFKGDETDEEIEEIVQEEFNEWVWNEIDASWTETI